MKLITFDFEGTLVNFQWNLEGAEREVKSFLQEKRVPEKLTRGHNYASIYNFIRENEGKWGYNPGELSSPIGEIYDTYDLDAASRWQPVKGIPDILDLLGDYRCALVSNVGKKGLDKVLDKFELRRYFKIIITRNDVTFIKPHPEGLLKVISRAGVKKEETLHVGDSLSDLFAARNAGIKAALILGGENSPEIILREKPGLVLQNIAELPEMLARIGTERLDNCGEIQFP